MNKAIYKLLFLIGVMPIILACFLSGEYVPTPIVTPGSIDLIKGQKKIPDILDWRYDPDNILVFVSGTPESSILPTLSLWNWHTGELHPIPISDLSSNADAVRNPNLDLIGYSSDNEIYLFNLETQLREKITSGANLDFSPDGKQIVFWQGNNLIVMDLKSRQELILHTWSSQNNNDIFSGYKIRWSPDGQSIVYIRSIFKGGIDNVYILAYMDLKDKREKVIDQDDLLSSVSWSPDSRMITYVQQPLSDTSDLIIYDVQNDCLIGKERIAGQGSTAFWSPDGSKIIIEYFGNHYFVNVEKVFGKPYTQLNCSK